MLAQATGVEAVPDHTRRACVREMSCSSAVWSVRLSADSTWIVTGDESRRVIIWDALKAAKVREMECDGQVTAVRLAAPWALQRPERALTLSASQWPKAALAQRAARRRA